MENSRQHFKLQLKDASQVQPQSLYMGVDVERQPDVLSGIQWHEYLLMFLLLALSGNPFFTQKLPIIVTLASVIPAYYILRNPNKNIAYRTFFIFLFFIGYELLHAFMFRLDYTLTIIKLSLVLLVSFGIVNILKEKFIKVLVATMYYISLISFVFTMLCYVPGVGKYLYNLAISLVPLKPDANGFITPTLVVYTFFPGFFTGEFSYVKNAGIFWEGGAFAVFLSITLYFHYARKKIVNLSDLFDKVSLVLIVAVLTTVSTMGFLSVAIILTFYTMQLESNAKYGFLVLSLIAFYVAYHSFEFLGSKIDAQLSASERNNNRFGSALLDFSDIMKRPMLGWSRRLEVLFDTTVNNAKSHRPNGLTNFIRNYGFLYFTVYFYLVFTSFKKIGEYFGKNSTGIALFGVLLLWLISFSELIFDAALLKSLVFLFFAYNAVEESDLIDEVS
jgi:hypothetical protein